MIDRARVANAAAGTFLLLIAGLIATYFFLTHNRYEREDVWLLGLLGFAFLFLIGQAYSLIFTMNSRR